MKRNLIIFGAAVILVLLVGVGGCTPVPTPCSDTFTVTTNLDANDGACTADHCSLREAVIAANACAGHQTIVVPAGNYQLTLLGVDEEAAATGDLDITDDLTLQGMGVPSIDGVAQDRIFEIFSPAVVEIDHFILINGLAQLGGAIRSHGDLTVIASSIHNNVADVPPGGSGGSSGGGIFIEAGSTTLVNTDVFDNYADVGGGVHNFATATFMMTGGHLTGNIASGWGGGLWNNMASHATLEDVEISLNTAVERGAGIYNNGTLEANLVTFTQNMDAAEGGGVYNDEDGEMFLTLAWFTNNNAQLGGGLYNRGLLHLYQGSLTNNSALGGQGGGAFNDGAAAALFLQNTTISSNMIVPFDVPGGSGVYNNGGDLRLEFVTFAYNNADGIGNNGGHVTLRSSILAYHALGGCAGVTGGSQGYNLEDGNTCSLIEPSDLVDTDPFLQWLAMNGGVNLNHALSPGSPAIDTGDPDRCIEVDQRGVARPQGLVCDRGAYEAETGDATPTPVDPTPTPVPTSTPTPVSFVFTPNINAYCRPGPDPVFGYIEIAMAGQPYLMDGRNLDSSWFRIMISPSMGCWVRANAGTPSGDTSGLRVLADVPTPTPTPVPFCSNFTDEKSCNAQPACQWIPATTRPAYCGSK